MQEISAKEKLLKVSARLFAQKGLEGTSVRDIAKEADLNLSLVSYYFGGKDGLYRELIHNYALSIKSEFEKIVEEFESESPTQENLERVLFKIVTGFSKIREQQPYMGVIMARERLDGVPYAREVYEEIFNPLSEVLIQLIIKAQKKGLVRKELNPLLIFIFLYESIIGFHNMMNCPLQLTKSPMTHSKNFKDFQKQLVAIFTQGIFL